MSPMTPSHVQMLSRIAAGEVCAIPVETHPPSLIIAGTHSASEYSQRINALIRTVFMISGLSRAVAAGQTGGGRENVGEVDECSGNSHLHITHSTSFCRGKCEQANASIISRRVCIFIKFPTQSQKSNQESPKSHTYFGKGTWKKLIFPPLSTFPLFHFSTYLSPKGCVSFPEMVIVNRSGKCHSIRLVQQLLASHLGYAAVMEKMRIVSRIAKRCSLAGMAPLFDF